MLRGNRGQSIATTLALLVIFGGLSAAPDVGAGVRRKARGAAARAASAPTVRHAIYGRILSIDADTVVVDRGNKDGLSVGRADLVVHPLRKRFGEKSKSIDALTVLSRKLYDKVLGPIEGDLQNADTVLVLPSGPLFSLPFGALESKVGGKTRYAVERWRSATMMSTTMASLDAPRPKDRWSSFAAFANPDGSLPGAEAEVTSVAREVFRGATVFVGPKAVAEAVRDIAGKARILHFATHGVLGGEAAASYLKMAKGPLTLDLISGLDFGNTTDLVVLSACQTAVAVGETAEEGISIAEAFAFGGVPTLIASLWSVPDDATSELMVRFYRLLRGGDVDTVEALRRSQLEQIALEKDGRRPFAHPLHWAAFGLIGDHR